MSWAKRLEDYFTAAEVGNVEQINLLIKKNDHFLMRNTVNGRSALHVAVHYNQEGVVRVLSKISDLCLMMDDEGHTPLHVAVSKGYVNIVEIFIQNRAKLDCYDEYDKTPLLLAISENNAEMVMLLVKNGALSEARKGCSAYYDNFYMQNNPLHMALNKDFKPIVQILINHIDLADICSCYSYTDPTFANEIFNQRLEMLVGEKCSDEKIKEQKEHALQLAVSHGRLYQVKRLIESGANVNAKYCRSYSLLHTATGGMHFSVLKYLLTKITDLNAVDDYGRTPLHHATYVRNWDSNFSQKDFEDSVKIMEILLKNGASVHVFDKVGKTPLHYAVEEKKFRPEKVRLLLDYKADVNAHLEEKPTPIFFANCGATVQMLIDKGANVNYRISDGWFQSPLHFAFQEYVYMKVEILLENGAKIDNFSFGWKVIGTESFETIVDGMMDVTKVIEMIVESPTKHRNLIPILAKRHFQGEITINSQEFLSPSFSEFSMFKECQEELERMRDVHVLSFNLLDILTMPIQKLRRYATENEVLNFFQSSTILYNKFNKYSGMIMKRFRKAKEERNLIDSSSEVFKKFVFRLHEINLPDLFVYRIMDMLHVVDLEKLVELKARVPPRTCKQQ